MSEETNKVPAEKTPAPQKKKRAKTLPLLGVKVKYEEMSKEQEIAFKQFVIAWKAKNSASPMQGIKVASLFGAELKYSNNTWKKFLADVTAIAKEIDLTLPNGASCCG